MTLNRLLVVLSKHKYHRMAKLHALRMTIMAASDYGGYHLKVNYRWNSLNAYLGDWGATVRVFNVKVTPKKEMLMCDMRESTFQMERLSHPRDTFTFTDVKELSSFLEEDAAHYSNPDK